MVKTKLVEQLIADGATLLRELDKRDFRVECMFWVLMPEESYWRLVIGSQIVHEVGSAAAYSKLGAMLQGVELAGVTLEDISLLDPSSQQFRFLLLRASASIRLAAGAAWVEYEDAVVYRWTGASISGQLTCDVSLHELERFWDAERTKANLPLLLISVEGRSLTLRFHPIHGNLAGIENIKQSFQIAMHRPDARRDCGIKWLN